jgi:hypothetical protein
MSADPAAVLDLSDLVQEAIDEPRHVSSRAAAGRLGAKSAPSEKDTLPHSFCEILLKLLNNLSATFPERDKLSTWIALMNATIINNPAGEVWAIERWHREMTTYEDGSPRIPSLYVLTTERRVEEVLAARVWVFEEIDARGLFYDPDFDDEDRETTCRFFDKLNTLSRMYAAIPPDMMDIADSIRASHDPTQPVTMETLQGVVQQVIGCSAGELGRGPESMERVMGWARHLTAGMATNDMPVDEDDVIDPQAMLDRLLEKGGLLDGLSNMVGNSLGEDGGITVKSIIQTAAAELIESRVLCGAGTGAGAGAGSA